MNSTQIKILKEENRRLREALEFYADSNNYEPWRESDIDRTDAFHCVDLDAGLTARQALGWEESQMENKATNEELLRQQLERLSKISAHAKSVEELVAITLAMTEVYKTLANNQMIQVTPLIDGEAID